MDKRYDKKVTV